MEFLWFSILSLFCGEKFRFFTNEYFYLFTFPDHIHIKKYNSTAAINKMIEWGYRFICNSLCIFNISHWECKNVKVRTLYYRISWNNPFLCNYISNLTYVDSFVSVCFQFYVFLLSLLILIYLFFWLCTIFTPFKAQKYKNGIFREASFSSLYLLTPIITFFFIHPEFNFYKNKQIGIFVFFFLLQHRKN